MHGSSNDAPQFFQKIKPISEGFITGASFCKDQVGNLVTDIKSLLDLWRAPFNAILNSDDTNNSANEMIRPSRPNTLDNATPVAPPAREEVAIAIQRLKLKKAEIFKAGADELVSYMHHLLCNIW